MEQDNSSLSRNLLYIAHRFPYPPNKGEKIRAYHQLKFLAGRGWKIHLFTLVDDVGDLDFVNELEKLCATLQVEVIPSNLKKYLSIISLCKAKPLSVFYFYSRRLQRRINQILKKVKFDAVLCYCSSVAEYLFRSPLFQGKTSSNIESTKNDINLVMDMVDVDSDKWHQYSSTSWWPLSWIYHLEYKLLRNYEKKITENFNAVILVSDAETSLLKEDFRDCKNVFVVPNGVDFGYFSPVPDVSISSATVGDLVFCGVMDYFPNIEGVLWFTEEILPIVRACIPDITFSIVGANPVTRVKALEKHSNVRVTGWVKDIRPYVWSSKVVVVPLRLARGIQNKVLEAMSMGKAIVTTSKALQGIDAIPGKHVLVADDPEAFANHVVTLLNDSEKRNLLGKNAHSFVREKYDWAINLERFERLLAGENYFSLSSDLYRDCWDVSC